MCSHLHTVWFLDKHCAMGSLIAGCRVNEKAFWGKCFSFSHMTDQIVWPCSFQRFPPCMLLALSFTGPWVMWCVTPLWLSIDEEIASLISRGSFHSAWQVTAWWQLTKPVYGTEHKPDRTCWLRPVCTGNIHSRWIVIKLVLKAYMR